jgi:hypothetical protein
MLVLPPVSTATQVVPFHIDSALPLAVLTQPSPALGLLGAVPATVVILPALTQAEPFQMNSLPVVVL